MLYFTESGWTLPDIRKVSEDFDREYGLGKYERKIAKLVKQADGRMRKGSRDDYERWWAAIRFLQREDHYILVMIRLAGLRPRGDQWRLFASGLARYYLAIAGRGASAPAAVWPDAAADLGAAGPNRLTRVKRSRWGKRAQASSGVRETPPNGSFSRLHIDTSPPQGLLSGS